MAFIIDDIMKAVGAKKGAKEATRAAKEQSQADFESATANETNREDERLGKAGYLSRMLTGNRALDPAEIASLMKRRQVVTRKNATRDVSKGVMWNGLGDAVNSAGNLGMKYATGLGLDKINSAPSGAAPTTLMPQGMPFNPGLGTGMFRKPDGSNF